MYLFASFYTVHEYRNLEIELWIYQGLPLNFSIYFSTLFHVNVIIKPRKIFFSGVFPGLRARINKYYLSNRRRTSKARLLGRSLCLPSFIMMSLIWIEVISKYRLSWWLIGKESACNTGGLGLGRSPREGNSSDSKASAYNVEEPGSIPGFGRSSGEGNGNPLQYSSLENPMDRGAW